MKKTTDLSGTSKGYKVFSVAILVVMVIFFLFPLYRHRLLQEQAGDHGPDAHLVPHRTHGGKLRPAV